MRMRPSIAISVSAGTMRSWVTALTTGSARPQSPPATAIDLVGDDVLLHRRLLDGNGWFGRADGAADEPADSAEIRSERGLAIGLARQHVADHRHVVALDVAEQDRFLAVALLHDAGD